MRTIDIIDSQTLERKGVFPVSVYQIETDSASLGISHATTTARSVQRGDFAIIRDGQNTIFRGTVEMGGNEDGAGEYKITMGEMENIFNQNIALSCAYLIAERGIEDFIATTITEQFKSSGDFFTDMSGINVVVNTHTKSTILPTSDNDIFNLKEYLVLVRETDNIFLKYEFGNGELLITVERREQSEILIDTMLTDISNYKEVFTDNVLAKLIVIWKRGSQYERKRYFLIETGEISENSDDPLRVKGSSDTIFIENTDIKAVYEEVGNRFRANAYEHSVEFNVSSSSRVIEKTQLYAGRAVKVRISDERIFSSIITRVSVASDSQEVGVKMGNLKLSLVEKLKGGRR